MTPSRGPVRLLTRHFFHRFLDNDLISPVEDLHETVATLLAGLAVGFAALALVFIAKYNPREAQPLAEKLAMALNDKTLLLGGAMVVTALAAAVQWNALSLDVRDLMVFGPLPIRPATLIVAKTAALTALVAGCAVAINALPAILFPLVVLAKAPVGLGYGLQWIAAHAVAGIAGSVFVFLALMGLRSVVLLALPGRPARRLLAAIQFLMVPALLTLLFVLPLLATGVRPAIESGGPGLRASPPLWFLGIEEVLIGRREPIFLDLARTGVIALGLSALIACLASVAAFLRGGQSGSALRTTAVAARRLPPLVDRAAAWLLRDDLARASYFFTAQALTRNPLHRVCVAAWLGLGFAVACGSIALAYGGIPLGRWPLNPESMVLAAQANLLFFLLIGVRVASTFPADLEAVWVFRFLAAPALRRHLAGTRCAVAVLLVLPLLVLLAPIHAVLWGIYPAVVHFACGIMLALLFLERLFHRFDRLPFASSHLPARTTFTFRLPGYLAGYLIFVYLPLGIERTLLHNPVLFVGWIGLLVMVVARLRGVRRRHQRDRLPSFEEHVEDVQQLGLSDAAFGAGRAAADDEPRGSVREAPGWLTRLGVDTTGASWGDADRGFVRAASWRTQLEQVLRDVRFAVRRLRAAPAFAGFAVLTLALGIGATTAIYSVVENTVLSRVEMKDIDRLVNVYHASPYYGTSPHYICFSYPDYRDLRATQTVFSELTAWSGFRQILVGGGTGEFVSGEAVSGEYFHLVGVEPSVGRTIQPADDEAAAPAVVVLSDAIWRARFGADPGIIGQTVRITDRPFEVVGIAPASFRGLNMPKVRPTDVWVALHAGAALLGSGAAGIENREGRQLYVRGRLKPGVTVSQARGEIGAIGRGLDTQVPIGVDLPKELHLHGAPEVRRFWQVLPTSDVRVHEAVDPYVMPVAGVTMAAVGLVLLVACTNLANLLLARGASRRHELAVRLALGATRGQLVREQLIESALVTALGGLAAIAVARVLMVYVFSATVRLGPGLNVAVAPSFSASVALVALCACGVALLVFGLVPALQMSGMTVQSALSSASANAVAPRWRGLIAWQVGVSVGLVAVASLCVHQIVVAAQRQTGVDLDHVAAVRYDFRMQGWQEPRAREAVARILETVRRTPGVQVAAISSGLIVDGGSPSARLAASDRPTERCSMRLVSATPGLFAALGLRVVRGRALNDHDIKGAAPAMVLTESAAQRLFGTPDVLGRYVTIEGVQWVGESRQPDETCTIVGLIGDIEAGDISARDRGAAFVPYAQHYDARMLVVARTSGDPAPFVSRLRGLVAHVAPELGVVDGGTGMTITGATSYALKVMAGVAGLLGALALGLAMTGLYGVLSYIVAGRTREMGVRMALGATRSRIMRLVMGDAVVPVVEGLVIGFTLAGLAGMALRPAFLRLLPAIDPLMYVAVPIPFLAATLAACYLPARRAASVDPNVALRQL